MLRKTVVAQSLALAFGFGLAGMAVMPAAYAQSNTTGVIYGQVDSAAGAEVVAENLQTGAKRTVKPDSAGRYQFNSLPTGEYRVSVVRGGAVVSKRDNVVVLLSQGAEVSFSATQRVEVTGTGVSKLDLSTATSSTILTARELDRLPVATNVGAVIQLAPSTTRGDSRYGGSGAPSFGGASASENAYYINGFPVTTLLTQVGFSQLPFNSIAQAQVLTGGYGAEFGRSTGGVVNIVTKRGGNEWTMGAGLSIAPNSLRATPKDQYYENNGTTLDGKLRWYNGLNKTDVTTINAYVSGPLIADKLYFFLSAENTSDVRDSIRSANTSATYTASAAVQSTAFQARDVEKPRWLLKLDYQLTDNHAFEYTHVSDKVSDNRTYYGFDYKTLQRTEVSNGGAKYVNWGPVSVASEQGAEVDIFKYTGNLTDKLTITALLGQTRTPHVLTPAGFNAAMPQVQFTSDNQIPGLNYVNNQGFTSNLLVPGSYDKNKGSRFDFEYKLSSAHSLRGGIDYNTITSKAGSGLAGGVLWRYTKTDPNVKPNTDTEKTSSVAGNPYAQQGYYVERIVQNTASTPTVDQQAQYIQDDWQVTDRLNLILGLRNEGFNNKNGDGDSYIKLNKQLAPRFAAIYDMTGDKSTKLFGTAGRYHVPLPTNVAVRGAGSSLNAQQNFVYTGIDQATGAPTGLTAISPLYSSNNELGQAKDPREVAAQGMKGNYQDELTLGIERAGVVKGWNAGSKFTYRTLRTAIDDHCDDRPFLAWAERNNVDASHWGYNCALFNPGRDNTFTLDLNHDGKLETIKLSAADLGIPPIKRTYAALDLWAEHPFDGKWWAKVAYTWSRNKGSTEGQLLSDIGQGDVSTTQAFDFPEFSVNSDGLLPNNRTHQLKAFAYYQATPEWGFGGNVLLASGRPRNCIGNAPDPVDSTKPGAVTNYSGYGSAYFFCNGVASPRGTAGKLPMDARADANISYSPSFAKGLKMKLDIFNLLNRQAIEVIEERYNTPGGVSTVWNRYATVESYNAPRSMKFTVTYDHKF